MYALEEIAHHLRRRVRVDGGGMLVRYPGPHSGVSRREPHPRSRFAWAWPWYSSHSSYSAYSPYGPIAQVQEYTQGCGIVDVIDPKTQELLWRGQGVAPASTDPATYAKEIAQSVSAILKKFPQAAG